MALRRLLAVAAVLAFGVAGCGGKPTSSDAPAPPPPPPPPPSRQIPFGTQGPWPVANAIYGAANGILESPVVGLTSDEAENRWVATPSALYLLRPGETRFRRYDGADGLHLPGFPARYCDDRPIGPKDACNGSLSTGEAAPPGIAAIVGGGPDEVFVGYHGVDEPAPGLVCPPKAGDTSAGADYCDPMRHSGKMDRVRVADDGTLQVDRFDFVAGRHGAEFWHDRTVQRLAFDHFVHPHTLYVGTNHGVDISFPDKFRLPRPGEWFDLANTEFIGDHLHARICQFTPPAPCPTNSEAGQRMGDWHALAIDANGDLWHGGRWTAGLIGWDADPVDWFERNGSAFKIAFGDPYPLSPNDQGFQNEPVFKVSAEGDSIWLTGVAVCPDGRVWFSSRGPQSGTSHTVAVWKGRSFDTFSAASLGLGESAVADIACLPDGRVVLAGPGSGLVIHDPVSGTSKAVRAGSGIPSDDVVAIEVDRMVSPPELHVATGGGAAVLRVLP